MAKKDFDLSKEEYKLIIDDLPTAVFGIEYNSDIRELKFTYLNKYALQFFSKIIDQNDLTGYISVTKLLKDFDFQSTQKFYHQLLKKKSLSFKRREFLFTTVTNKQIIIEATVNFTIRNGLVTINGIFEETSEIVEIKKQKAISKKEGLEIDFESIKEFFEAFDALIMIVDENGRIGFVSPNVDDSDLYKPRAEIIGKTFDEIFPEGQANFFLAHVMKAIDEDKCIDIQYHLPIKNEVRWFQSRAFPVKTQVGETKQVVTIIREITDWIKKPIEN